MVSVLAVSQSEDRVMMAPRAIPSRWPTGGPMADNASDVGAIEPQLAARPMEGREWRMADSQPGYSIFIHLQSYQLKGAFS